MIFDEKQEAFLVEDGELTSSKRRFFFGFTLQVLTADAMEKSMSAEASTSKLWKTCKLSKEHDG